MKIFTCPDCGKEFEEGSVPSACPNCACPMDHFKSREIENLFTNPNEHVYYSDKKVRISNQIWSLGGWDEVNTKMAGVMYIPVKSISCVDIARNMYWWTILIWAVLFAIGSVILWSDPWFFYEDFYIFTSISEVNILGAILLIVGVFLGWVAFKVRNYRRLIIKAHNPFTQFSFHLSTPKEATKYLNPMLQCLQENM